MVSGRCSETDGVEEFVQVVDYVLIQPIELTTLPIWQGRVSSKRLEQARGQGCVNAFKEFEEDVWFAIIRPPVRPLDFVVDCTTRSPMLTALVANIPRVAAGRRPFSARSECGVSARQRCGPPD
jgi:hypothetical protein